MAAAAEMAYAKKLSMKWNPTCEYKKMPPFCPSVNKVEPPQKLNIARLKLK